MKKKRIIQTFVVTLCAMLLLSGCSLPGLGGGSDKNSIKVTALSTTESQILSYMIKDLVEHETDYKVEIIGNLGSAYVNHQALVNKEADISSTRYTGTDLMGVLGLPAEKDTAKALKIVQKEFDERYDQIWMPSYGFTNSYAFMVTKETAEKYGLEKVSDLSKVSDQLVAGADSTWLKRKGDGYDAFQETYGFDFKKIYPMQIGLVYDALEAGKMDVVLGYTTDGRISSYDLVVLEDDLKFFPPYDASMVVRKESLKEHPGLEEVINKLNGKITTEEMQKLNYRADNDLVEPAIVAKEFLVEHHYFDDDKGGD
ncbi:osmoprotectant ABC transporter substrate-binding protein [Isobaculum melis]|uniref:Osmoprotectant transport system substrate-binding protein n=1 Tax=Isobaculum melis TaxID=142588 RepID=A0A1H9R9C4_9LACT|nr:osmoprotectant ABC transporter substrate-binding protein [Isobaculum melis]SER69326.1 osmoprotectant transport system substrate-binding protein [Isobaculum melis]